MKLLQSHTHTRRMWDTALSNYCKESELSKRTVCIIASTITVVYDTSSTTSDIYSGPSYVLAAHVHWCQVEQCIINNVPHAAIGSCMTAHSACQN